MNFSEKISNIRDQFGYQNKSLNIKLFEYFLITTCLLLKEIIELTIQTIKFFISLFSSTVNSFFPIIFSNNKTSTKSGIESLFSNVHIFGERIFWIWFFKVFINVLVLLYFFAKYGKKFFYSDGMILWIFLALSPISELLIILSKSEFIGYFSEISKLFIFLAMGIYFIKIDKTLVDSWKLAFYNNLHYCPETNRYIKTEDSFISKEKIKKLLTWIFASVMIIIVFNICLDAIMSLINKKSASIKTENQKSLETEFKNNKWTVLFSVVFMAPIIEEVLMRKSLMSLGKLRWFTIINSAFLFALIHLSNENIFHLIPYFIPGIIFAFIYWSTWNIWNPIFIHAIINFFAWISLILRG